MYDRGYWEAYDSEMMFPGCQCGHDATEHRAAWGDWRPGGAGCLIDGCLCEVGWVHT